MKAMILRGISNFEMSRSPLEVIDLPKPVPGGKEILVEVSRCGVCHTELDEIRIRPEIQEFRLEEANKALLELKERKIRGAKVLKIR